MGARRLIEFLVLTLPRQWVKNPLVAAVPLAAGKLFDEDVWPAIIIAGVAFLLLSASTYIVNDLRDAEFDRQHPSKMARPIAGRRVSGFSAGVVAGILVILGLFLAATLSNGIQLVALGFLLVQLAYMGGLKQVPLGDVSCIALGFVLRAIAGGSAADLPVTSSFVIVVSAVSFFVATAKCAAELNKVGVNGETRIELRMYSADYLRLLWSSSMTVAIVAYVIWSSEIERGSVLAKVSVAPFALAMFRYASHVIDGDAEETERVVLRDSVMLLLALAWAAVFVVQSFTL